MTGPIVLTLLVRDEADIVGDMLRFHLRAGVDHVIAMDNASTDGTSDILRDFEAMGVLTRVDQPSDSYLQDVWTTEMARMALEDLGAAWVIPSDADEFWMPDDAGADLRDVLAAVPPDVPLVSCARANLFAPWEEIETLGWRDALVWRAVAPAPLSPARLRDPAPLEQPFAQGHMPPKAILRPEAVTRIGRGAHPHDVDLRGEGRARDVPVTIRHAPFRDRGEVAASVARIGRAIAADPTAGPDVSAKYRRWHAMAETGGIDAVTAEIMPAPEAIARDRMAGLIRPDSRLSEAVVPRDGSHAARLALSAAGGGPDRIWQDSAGPSVPVLLAGGTHAARGRVAARLKGLGVREIALPVEAPVDWQARIAAILRAMGSEPREPLLAELRASRRMHEGGWHGLLIDDPEITGARSLWRAFAAEGEVAPALILLADADTDTGGGEAVSELEAQSRDMPRLVASSSDLLGAAPERLHAAMACLGLWVPLSVALTSAPVATERAAPAPDLLRAGWGLAP
ncbi:glycosyltransferase family 2 protein [Palleronia sp. LCG004]|uniref:glycosyltransferase family 2 protein n=1 Tax=Palleronia sp. LCG004 TaxID=3079304 RepID=UPI002943992C|nr:glycosyltransferase family 2 protein [Palleronia sp. LCG004]WOI58452.1 glycosyltransferase family 2 protein [Palleronia sp. LCG004]